VHRSFVSYIATNGRGIGSGDKGKLTVHQVDTAIDCGMFINPERIESQNRGCRDHGPEPCQYGEITFKDGKVATGQFRHDFPVIRIDEAPLVTNVHIVPADADRPPSGVGEAGRASLCSRPGQRDLRSDRKRIRTLPIGKQLET